MTHDETHHETRDETRARALRLKRPEPPPRRLLRAESIDDVLAAVPVLLGFEPADSVVMMTFGGPHCFHARADLVRDHHLDGVVAALLEPARRHRVPSVLFVIYTDDQGLGRRAGLALQRAFESTGIAIKALVRADGRRWYVAAGRRHGVPEVGVAYDIGDHPFRVQAVVDGQVTHGSRAELAASLQPDAPGVQRVARVLARAVDLDRAALSACCAGRLRSGEPFDDVELASIALVLDDAGLREAAWSTMRREDAVGLVALWSDALRRTPADLVPGVASVLAFACWLAGHGALAWCAVDRATAAQPGHPLAELVAALLTDAVPPSTWSPELMARIS